MRPRSKCVGKSNTYRTGLGLGDEIAAEDGGLDGALLDGRGLLETVGVDAAEELLGKFHAVEGLDGLVPVGVDVGIGQAAGRGIVAALGLRRRAERSLKCGTKMCRENVRCVNSACSMGKHYVHCFGALSRLLIC